MTEEQDVGVLEAAKYAKVWEHRDYRVVAPGESFVLPFLKSIKPRKGAEIYDYGTGTGRAAYFLHLRGFDVYPLDIAENCLDDEVREVLGDKLQIVNLFALPEDFPKRELGFCTDVMEHIPPEKVDVVLENIKRTCKGCFFNICFMPDHFGEVIGDQLHLTVEGFNWWVAKLREFGNVTQGRDLIRTGAFYVEFEE